MTSPELTQCKHFDKTSAIGTRRGVIFPCFSDREASEARLVNLRGSMGPHTSARSQCGLHIRQCMLLSHLRRGLDLGWGSSRWPFSQPGRQRQGSCSRTPEPEDGSVICELANSPGLRSCSLTSDWLPTGSISEIKDALCGIRNAVSSSLQLQRRHPVAVRCSFNLFLFFRLSRVSEQFLARQPTLLPSRARVIARHRDNGLPNRRLALPIPFVSLFSHTLLTVTVVREI